MSSTIVNETMFHVKILYKNGKHKYANIFQKKDYDMGLKIGTIIGYRKMNFVQRFVFRNCL